MLKPYEIKGRCEVGCDEAGRGCLAGPVVAAAVILPEGYENEILNDSKQLTARQRALLRTEIEAQADAWAVAVVQPADIDRLNILHASTHAMCLSVQAMLGQKADNVSVGGTRIGHVNPQFLLIDGNRFYNETGIPYKCIIKGDAKYMAIAAASILAKTHRDEIMEHLDTAYPHYLWKQNKGYPTRDHYLAIEQYGITPQHRRSFALYRQRSLFE
ncbi:MAG: ribonuclease HII [Bacteroidales bacterium]|nr:ribonuclease HII [Bacteroidales bacterium]